MKKISKCMVLIFLIMLFGCEEEPKELIFHHKYPFSLFGYISTYYNGNVIPVSEIEVYLETDQNEYLQETDADGFYSFSFSSNSDESLKRIYVDKQKYYSFFSNRAYNINEQIYKDKQIDIVFLRNDIKLDFSSNVQEINENGVILLTWNDYTPFGYKILWELHDKSYSNISSTAEFIKVFNQNHLQIIVPPKFRTAILI